MLKKFMLIVTVITIISTLVIYAKDNIKYEVYDSNIRIFFGDKKIKFDLPVVVIDNYTYIPLRETAEKFNIDIKWDKNESKIILDDYMYGFDIYKIFENLFKFKLPSEAKILNYDYEIVGGKQCNNDIQCLSLKISINENDIEFIKNSIKSNNEWRVINEWETLSYMKKTFSWWNLTDITETILSYGYFSNNSEKLTADTCFFINKESDSKYYLYAVYK